MISPTLLVLDGRWRANANFGVSCIYLNRFNDMTMDTYRVKFTDRPHSLIDQWREMHAAKVVSSHAGHIGPLYPIDIDMMPADLIARSFGRLSANCYQDSLGLISAYLSFNDSGWWRPSARRATKNTKISPLFLAGVEKYYKENYSTFLDTPKYPPA